MTIEATPIAIDDEDVVIATATAVGTANNDIESREEGQISTIQVEAIPEAAADVNTDKHVGRGLGITMLILLLIGGSCAIIASFNPNVDASIPILCAFGVLVIASMLACCCSTINSTNVRSRLPPNAQVFAVLILTSIILIILSSLIWWYTDWVGLAEDYGGYVVQVVSWALYLVAVLFTLLFIWGCDACCVPKQIE